MERINQMHYSIARMSHIHVLVNHTQNVTLIYRKTYF